jgi:multidrug efflux pump subunit AcrB
MVGEQSFILDQGNVLGASEATVYFQAANASGRESVLEHFKQWMAEKYPEALYSVSPPQTIFEKIFGDNEAPFEVRLWTNGNDPVPKPEVMHNIVGAIAKLSAKYPEKKVPLQEYYEISPRFDRIKLYDVPIDRLTSILKKSLNRLKLFTLRQGQYEVPVILTGKQQDIYKVIRSVRVLTDAGGLIPIDQLVSVKRIAGYKLLQGGKEGAYASLAFDVPDNELATVQEDVRQVLKAYPNVHVQFAGSLFANRALFKELIVVLVVALLLLYFILASQFESVLQPFIVFIEIPIDIAGALLVLWVSGNSMNLMSMIGIVVMTGIIINDSILKIDTINGLVRSGRPVLEAIHIGGRRRLKPIIMTSATTILAMVPFLWGHDMGSRLQQPLAWAIIGGMTIGTFVSLYFVPLAYYYLNRKKK